MRKKQQSSSIKPHGGSRHTSVCAHCATQLQTKQQNHMLIINEGKTTSWFYYHQIVSITVANNYCDIFLMPEPQQVSIKHCVRSTLENWNYLTQFGIVRVSPSTSINLLHVYQVSGSLIYSRYFPSPVEVTKSYKLIVSVMLKKCLQIEHHFGKPPQT